MGCNSYDELRKHIGHKIRIVCYGEDDNDPENISVECEDCNCVLLDFDRPKKIE